MFIKSDPAGPGAYPAEAAGLTWLAEARGASCVAVREVDDSHIVLDELKESRPTREAAHRFGAALAITHRAGAPAFGSAPKGWDGPCFIGRQSMPVGEWRSWGEFYADARVLPYAERAVERGNLSTAELDRVRRTGDLIRSGIFDDDEPPARLHGDLWAGNVMWTATGAVLIDPAAHGGHRETDLAMLALFGAPFLVEVLAGYDEVSALREGWQERVALHQLFPLAVHAVGHGRSYGLELLRACAAVDALAAGT